MRAPLCLAASAIALLASPAAAFGLKHGLGNEASAVTWIAKRQRAQPLKDCTRYNGRHGFYGNIWCTEAEQRAWDLHTSPRSVSATRR